jgi:hypothetical protein
MANYNAVDTVADISEDRLYVRGLQIEKGRPRTVRFQFLMQDVVNDPTGNSFMPFDITGGKIAATVSKGSHSRVLERVGDLVITVLDAVEGIFEVTFPAEITELFIVGAPYAFDVMWFDGTEYKYPIKGTIEVLNRSTVLDDVDAAEEI